MGAYVSWGILPLYWKALQAVPATQILAHRMSWSVIVALILVGFRGGWSWLWEALTNRKTLFTFSVTGAMLTTNWFIFIWAVNADRVVDASLGYFISPLVSVLLGRIFLGERLRQGQLLAIFFATCGVAYLTFGYGQTPWIGLTLASTFGLYGLLRKTATLGSLEGFTLETFLYFPPAVGYLIWVEVQGTGALGHLGWQLDLLMVLAGAITAGPLLLFAAGARLLSLSSVGILQYISPSLQFLLGVFVYREPLSQDDLIAFALIWTALAIYSVENLLRARRLKNIQKKTP